MKIRIKGNSVRFRLTKTEVETYCETGSYEEQTEFNEKTFKYCLKSDKSLDKMKAEFNGITISILMPSQTREDWQSEKVGFQDEMKLDNGKSLFLLVEKDFVCLDETVEDQSDNYPNPAAQSIH